ncbi:MAG TPA: M14 family zinc carboxypeptidase [Rummeliibacillus sp.]|nr:M14 family zinc carboxypeptidase [Rummeliibacillus sp.]
MEMQSKIKRSLVYSAGFLLSMSLLSNDALAAEVSGQDNAIKVTKSGLENSSKGDNNQTQTNDTNSSESGSENQIIENFAKISSDAELFTPESIQPTNLKLPADDHTYYVTKSSNEDYFEIHIGENTYWIKAENLIASTENPSELTQKRNLIITTKSNFNIYSEKDNNSKILVEGTKETTFKVIDVVQDYYVVSIAGVRGYIPISDVDIEYKKNSNVEVATSSVKMYKIDGGKYKTMGSLVNGAVVKVVKSTAKYHIIQVGNQTYAILEKGTIPTEKPASLGTLIKSTYPITLTVSKTNSIYTSKGNKMGTIDKGQVVSLKGLKGNKGIINYMGKSGYVDLKYFNHSNIVNPTKNITYGMYNYYLRVIAQLYPEFTEVEKIGESVQGRSIYALRVGNGKKEILMDAAIHAREHMTTNVLMEMIDQYTVSYRKGSNYAGYNVKNILDKTSIWFVPMMNPDGVTLVQKGIGSMESKYKANLKKYNHGSNNFNRWKANGRGVDLNRNFDGLWKYVATTPKSYMNYKGTSAFSEPEAQALKAFVQRHQFKTDLSYHSSGQIVYWFNFQKSSNRTRDLNLAKSVARITGYSVVPPLPYRGSGSSADWFILNQKKPGLTIEIAPYAGYGPVPHRYWSSVWNKNKSIGLYGANEASKR